MTDRALRILLVEDDEDLVAAYQKTLTGSSIAYELEVSRSGLEALEILARRPDTDLVLLDLGLPDLDGFQVLSRIKERPALSRVSIVIISARQDHGEMARAQELGATYLTKPVNLPMLEGILDAIARHLQESAERRRTVVVADSGDRRALLVLALERFGLAASGVPASEALAAAVGDGVNSIFVDSRASEETLQAIRADLDLVGLYLVAMIRPDQSRPDDCDDAVALPWSDETLRAVIARIPG